MIPPVQSSDSTLSPKRLAWACAVLALLGAAACTPAQPRPEAIIVPPSPPVTVENRETPVIRPRDPDLPDAAPTTPVDSAPLPPARRR